MLGAGPARLRALAARRCARAGGGSSPTYVSTLRRPRPRGWIRAQARLAIPGGVIAAGTIYNYSFPGLAWLVLAAVAWALLIAWRERERREGSCSCAPALRWATPLLIAGRRRSRSSPRCPSWSASSSFAGFEAFSPSGEGGNTGFGNLRQPLNPLEALGRLALERVPDRARELEHAGDRLLPRRPAGPGRVRAGASAGRWPAARPRCRPRSLAGGARLPGRARRRHRLHLGQGAGDRRPGRDADHAARPALGRARWRARSPTSEARLVAAEAACGRWSGSGSRRSRSRSSPPPRSRPCCRCASRRSGPTDNAEVLIGRSAPLVHGEDVLFLGRDNFISWELLGAEVYTPILNHYDTEETSTLYRATPINAKFDWDNVPAQGIEGIEGARRLRLGADHERRPQQRGAAGVRARPRDRRLRALAADRRRARAARAPDSARAALPGRHRGLLRSGQGRPRRARREPPSSCRWRR